MQDFYYLLNRGYPRKASLNLVVSRYKLSSRQKTLIERCVHEEDYNIRIIEKIIDPYNSPSNFETLVVDLYNTTHLIQEALHGHALYECTDHVLRDNAKGEQRSWKKPSHVEHSTALLAQAINRMKAVRHVTLVADKQVPRSGEAMALAKKALRQKVPWASIVARLARKADILVAELSDERALALTSDRLILERAHYIADARIILKSLFGSIRVISLRRMLEE